MNKRRNLKADKDIEVHQRCALPATFSDEQTGAAMNNLVALIRAA